VPRTTFTLEALQADQGDCLLLHYGSSGRPLVMVIDAGPSGIYNKSLRPRLEELRASRAPNGALPLELVLVSHIDDDHINGVLGLTRQLVQEQEDGAEPTYAVRALWHNSFDDIVGGGGLESLPSAVAAVATGDTSARVAGLSEPARLVVASIDQGRKLRDGAAALGLEVNPPFSGVVRAPRTVDWGDGLELTVIGPPEDRLEDLQRRWDEDVRRRSQPEAVVAGYLDRSVYNLSSIVVLAQAGRKRMLLTGDARGDDILEGLRAAGLLRRPPLEVDILKLPHHGSDRNVETEFFRTVVADHYVVSGDGANDNPEIAALRMISEARDDDDFVLHLTNRTGKNRLGPRLERFERDERRRGRRYDISFRDESALSLKVDLLDPVAD
jgi:glyoxylase-like metal-dependent hydrolase (beta-lactamase superfamily II)